jgi:hypothetical protein
MNRTMKLIAGGIVAAAIIGGGATGIAVATGAVGDSNDTPITGDALTRAGAAALAHTGGGRVTGTEVGDEESLYEVEVTLDDGTQIDVQLDENFNVVANKVDTEDTNDTSTDQ